jgi:aspartate 1-decarboxylase
MMRRVCKSKIHGALLTAAYLNYVSSPTSDRAWDIASTLSAKAEMNQTSGN